MLIFDQEETKVLVLDFRNYTLFGKILDKGRRERSVYRTIR